MRGSLDMDGALTGPQGFQKIDDETPQNVGEYQFLRAVWTTHRCSDDMSVDDRLDRLNKVVAMVRGNLSHKYCNLKNQPKHKSQNEASQQLISYMEEPAYMNLKEKLETVLMEKEEMIMKYERLLENNKKLIDEVGLANAQAKKTKEKVRALQIKFLEACKRQQDANDKLSRLSVESAKIKNSQKTTFSGSGFIMELYDFTVRNLENTQEAFRLNIGLQDLKDYLEARKDSIVPDTSIQYQSKLEHPSIPRLLLRGQKQNFIQPLKSDRSSNEDQKLARSRSRMKMVHTMSTKSIANCENQPKFTRKQVSDVERFETPRQLQQSKLNMPHPNKIFDERNFYMKQLSGSSTPIGRLCSTNHRNK